MINLGDQPAGSTMYVPFATYSAAGASITITGLAVTDIEIYKNGSTTQRASDNGYALLDTDGIDFDGITGIHGFSIDLSDNTTAGFYAAGSTYWLVVSAITVDTQTVNFVYYFTIDRDNVLRPTTAGRTLDVTTTGEAGLDFTNISAGARRIPELGIADRGTASAATSNTVTLQTGHGYSNNTANGKTLIVWGTTAGTETQTRGVLSSSGDVFTLDAALTETPTGTISYIMLESSPIGGIIAALIAADPTIVKLAAMINGTPAFSATALALAPTASSTEHDLIHTGTTTAVGSFDTLGSTDLGAGAGTGITDYLRKWVYIPTTANSYHSAEIIAQNLGASPPTIQFTPVCTTSIGNAVAFKILRKPPAAIAERLHAATIATVNTIAGTIQTLDALDTAQDTQHTATMNRLGAPAGASHAADAAAIKVQTAAIEVDTQDLQSRLPAVLISGRMDARVGAMGIDSFNAAAMSTDAKAAIGTAVGTRQIPDSYAADGVQPTIDQAILGTIQALTEAIISGSTILIKKPDGTTTAMTITCSPSVAAAVSRTRTA